MLTDFINYHYTFYTFRYTYSYWIYSAKKLKLSRYTLRTRLQGEDV